MLVPVPINVVHDLNRGGCGATTALAVLPEPGTVVLNVLCAQCGTEIRVPLTFREVEDQLFHAFGDESSFNEVVVYGVVVFHGHDRLAAETELATIKHVAGVAPTTEIHCRVLFNEHARGKSEWKDWSEDRIFALLKEVLTRLRLHRPMYCLSGVNRTEYPREFPEGAGFPGETMEAKQLTGILFQGVSLPLFERLGAENVRLWIDPDPTRIPWFGRHVQAHRNFQSKEPTTGNVLAAQPVSAAGRPSLLEVADVLAYAGAHALSSTRHRTRCHFEKLYRICRPDLRVLKWDPEGTNPRSTLDEHHARIVSVAIPRSREIGR